MTLIELQAADPVGRWRCRHCGRLLVYWKRGYHHASDYGAYHLRCAEILVKEGKAVIR